MAESVLLTNPALLSVAELGSGEQLVLWSTRRLMSPGGCPLAVVREFHVSLHSDAAGQAAYESLVKLLEILGAHGRRPLRPLPLTCARVSQDERALIALIAAHQASDGARAAALIRWLLPPRAAVAAAKYASRVAAELKRSGRLLHQRRVPRPERPGPAPRLRAAAARPAWLR